MTSNFKIIEGNSKEDIIKQLVVIEESNKIVNFSITTNEVYSKTLNISYTKYTVLVQFVKEII